MKTLLELHQTGVISYLVKASVVSTTVLAYIEYYEQFVRLRGEGRSYRDAVQCLATMYQVSVTTIKKGVRMVTAAERMDRPPLRMAS